jgi:hypothetical protein
MRRRPRSSKSLIHPPGMTPVPVATREMKCDTALRSIATLTAIAETLSIWNYTASAWVTMKTATVGTTASTTTVIPAGSADRSCQRRNRQRVGQDSGEGHQPELQFWHQQRLAFRALPIRTPWPAASGFSRSRLGCP